MVSVGAIAAIILLVIGLSVVSTFYVASSSNVSSLRDSLTNEQSQISYMQEHPSITTITSTSTNIETSTTTNTIQIPYYIIPTSDLASSTSGPLNIHIGQKVPIPTGIADYGVANNSGVLSAYKVAASQVVAQATINSLGAYNSSVNSYVVTLQLNLDLNVNTTSGIQEFWVQNIASSRPIQIT